NRRINVLREGKPLPDIKDKTVILVDDGLAMGSTMQAAIKLCRNKRAKKIIVAVPVAGVDVAENIGKIADEIAVLEMPVDFYE
ncbi:MAG: phosphoribosyltransferase family protein, partial [Candidatus Aminicenantes bacterium]|nr:phosphoribosyltransferase family protein [Candidatus Aminicenantes bacterium]